MLRRLAAGLAMLLVAGGVVVAPAMTMAAGNGHLGGQLASQLAGHVLLPMHPDPIDPPGG